MQFESACPESGVSPPSTNRGSKTTYFGRLRNSTASLTAYISSERNTTYISEQRLCKLQGVSYIVSKQHELWSTNGFKLEVSFHPPSVNSAFHFIARLRRRRSANGTQPNFVKQWTVNRVNNPRRKVGVIPPEKNWGPKTYICSVFRQLRDLMGEYLLNETGHRQSGKGVGKHEGRYIYIYKRLKTGPEFLTTLILFRPTSSHTLYAALTWRPTATLNETALGLPAAQIWSPKRC